MSTHIEKFEYAKKQLNIKYEDVQQIRSKPCNRGVIRVDYFKVNRTYYILDDSENSEGYYRAIGERQKKLIMADIERAA